MDHWIQYGLFTYLMLNFGLTFAWPSYRVWKQTGVIPITFSNADTAHDFIGKVFKWLLGMLLCVGALYAFYPKAIPYLLPFWYLQHAILQKIGIFILFTVLFWIAFAQYQMANSWRIGIDEQHKTPLVTAGIFAISRNPIFLGMLGSLLGIFLVIPNAVTGTILVTGVLVVQIQVRLEEAFLHKMHGTAYEQYCKQTRRWL